ncbi:hypothetical protein Hte_002121 [Hypoxylon texense]
MVDASNRPANTAYPNPSEEGILSNGPPQSLKRIRACIACRNMKIKCISVPGSNNCEACLRYSRPCQDPGPPKARVKTSQKFTDLEKRIDALTSALDAERRRNQQLPKQVTTEVQWSKTPDSNPRDDDVFSPTTQQGQELEDVNDGRDIATCSDVVDLGVIDISSAALLFDHWKFRMRPFMPVIRVSADEGVHTIRTKKPTLFLTIMTIAGAAVKPSIVPRLLTQLNSTLAQDVFIQGAKSLDLLQSLILFSQYYIQPPHVKAFAMPQHAYSAVIMSHDLGLGATHRRDGSNDTETKETYRTLLAVYLGASCSATILRRHQPLISTSSHRDYIEALTRDRDGDHGDQWLCSLVALQELFDEVSKTLNTSYGATDESFDDFRIQHLLGIFRQRLNGWKVSRSGEIDQRLKNHAASVADLYIHQVAIRTYNCQMLSWLQNKEQNGPAQPHPVFTPAHTDALCHCLKVSANIMKIYLSLDEATSRSLPNVFLLWNMCAAVCLIKLGYFAENLSSRRTHEGVSSDLPTPAPLLEAMIQKLSSLSQHGYFPQSRPFIIAFKKLKMWFQQKKAICINNNGDCYNGTSGPIHYIVGTQTPPASPSTREAHIHKPSSAKVSDRDQSRNPTESRYERDMAATPEVQSTSQRSPDWDPYPYTSEQSRRQANDVTLTNNPFDVTHDTNYSNANLGDFQFDFNDMLDIDNFMRQTDDDGLWSLL